MINESVSVLPFSRARSHFSPKSLSWCHANLRVVILLLWWFQAVSRMREEKQLLSD